MTEIYKNYDEKRILANAQHTLKELQKDNIKTSIGGFLRKALKNDYASQISLSTIKLEQQQAKEKEELDKLKAKQKEQEKLSHLKQDFNHTITQKVEEYISTHNNDLEAHYERFKEKFSFAIGDEKDIKKAIDEKPMIRNFFINFLSKKVLDKRELDFEEFLKNAK